MNAETTNATPTAAAQSADTAPEQASTGKPTRKKTTPKAAKAITKAHTLARRVPGAPVKANAGKKATPARKTPKGRTKPKAAKPQVREGSKTAAILGLLKRPGGVTAKELGKATNWQPHSVRGFLSGTVGKKMGLTVISAKSADRDRVYAIKA